MTKGLNAEEIAAQQDIKQDIDFEFEVPKGWFRQPDGRERWGGPDPTFVYRHGRERITLTHYGLEGSHVKTSEDYLSWLGRVLDAPKSTEEITVAGKKTRLLRFEFHYEGFQDHHGAFIPHEFVYEEFVVIPAQSGFWSLNLNISRVAPFQFDAFPEKRLEERSTEFASVIKDWKWFLERVRESSRN